MSERMNISAWVPQSALVDGRLDVVVRQRVEAWALDWMDPNVDIDVEPSNATYADASVSINEAGRDVLAAACLQRPLEGMGTTEGDRETIERLINSALSDLEQSFAGRHTRAANHVEVADVKSYDICLNGQSLLGLTFTRSLASALRKMDVSTDGDLSPLSTLTDATREQLFTLEAHAGRLDMDFKTLEALAIGDVFELPSALGEPFGVIADGRICQGVAARFVVAQSTDDGQNMAGLILE